MAFQTESSDAYQPSVTLRLELAEQTPDDPDVLEGLPKSLNDLALSRGFGGSAALQARLIRHALEFSHAAVESPQPRTAEWEVSCVNKPRLSPLEAERMAKAKPGLTAGEQAVREGLLDQAIATLRRVGATPPSSRPMRFTNRSAAARLPGAAGCR